MKTVTKLFLFIAVIGFATTTAYAQNRPDVGSVGIMASLQSEQTNIKLPIWASERIVIAPVVGISHVDDNYTQFNVGINPRFYQSLGNDFATFIGVQGLLQHTSPEQGDNDSDFLLGASGGGEYFLDEHFSLGVEGQLNFLIEDSSNNAFATAAAITGTFYF
ncbi:MAG TPA: hypothetical protein VK112_06155 [Fodinibius sp.]|nr:hypothetical protein [Fodinibius sp.]